MDLSNVFDSGGARFSALAVLVEVATTRSPMTDNGASRSSRAPVLSVARVADSWQDPVWFHRPAGQLLLLAAVDSPLEGASAKAPVAFSIITVPPGQDVAAVHDRQPAILSAS